MDTTATVWQFIDIVSSPSFKDTFNLIVHKIDKKKEKTLSFAFKQHLMDSLKTEMDIQKLCPLVLSLAVYQLTSSVLDLPSDMMASTSGTGSGTRSGTGLAHHSSVVVSFLLAWIRPPRLSSEDAEAVTALLHTADAGDGGDSDEATRREIADAAKQAVLNAKKPSPSSSSSS